MQREIPNLEIISYINFEQRIYIMVKQPTDRVIESYRIYLVHKARYTGIYPHYGFAWRIQECRKFEFRELQERVRGQPKRDVVGCKRFKITQYRSDFFFELKGIEFPERHLNDFAVLKTVIIQFATMKNHNPREQINGGD